MIHVRHCVFTNYQLPMRRRRGKFFFLTTFALEFKTNKTMEEKKVKPFHIECQSAQVDVYSVDEEVANRLLRGRALLDVDSKKFMFAQNEPRGPRSMEVGRTMHSRLVRRPDSRYTLTFSCMDGGEKQLKEQLIAEVRDIMKMIGADMERRSREQNKTKREEKKNEK